MKARVLLAALSCAPLLVGVGAASATAAPQHSTTYYVSLGDSLSQGHMPQGDTDRGYADRLYDQLKRDDPNLKLVKLGCSGETTGTMMNGGVCDYGKAGNQLKAAERFLEKHRGKVKFVTIDIGANDVQRCASPTGIDPECVAAGIANVGGNLPQILDRVREAGGKRAQYAGMNLYDPFLAAWLTGPDGQRLAVESVAVQKSLNGVIDASYDGSRYTKADVSAAFDTYAFSPEVPLPGHGNVPLNVARICAWTFMCTHQDIHANDTGYQVIADTFAAALV